MWLRGPLAVSLAAQVGVTPVLLATFGTVPVITPVANLLAAPAAEAVGVYGMLASAVGGLVPPLAPVLQQPSGVADRVDHRGRPRRRRGRRRSRPRGVGAAAVLCAVAVRRRRGDGRGAAVPVCGAPRPRGVVRSPRFRRTGPVERRAGSLGLDDCCRPPPRGRAVPDDPHRRPRASTCARARS